MVYINGDCLLPVPFSAAWCDCCWRGGVYINGNCLLPVPFSAAWGVIAMGGVGFISMVIVYCLFPSLLPGVGLLLFLPFQIAGLSKALLSSYWS